MGKELQVQEISLDTAAVNADEMTVLDDLALAFVGGGEGQVAL